MGAFGVLVFSRSIKRLLVIAAVLAVALGPPVPVLPGLGVTAALADDDGGGDDGGGGGNRGGKRGASANGEAKDSTSAKVRRVQAKKPVAKAQTRRVAPQRPVLVALDLSDSAVTRLRRQGYAVLSDDRLSATGLRVLRLQVPAGVSLARARTAVVALGASAADLNTIYTPQSGEDCGDDQPCKMRRIIGWPEDQTGPCKASARIGLVETHVDLGHPALATQKITLIDVRPANTRKSDAAHGTGIASLLVGAIGSPAQGLLPHAELIVATPFYRSGKGDRAEAAGLIRAIDAVAAHRPDVLNLSLAGPPNAALEHVLKAVHALGIPVVAAAGNGGARSKPLYPAAYGTSLAVTAVTPGLTIFKRATRGAHIDIAAPGVDVVVAGPEAGVARMSGTSFAAPFVTASVALIRKTEPELPLASLERAMALRAHDLGKPGKDSTFGWGLIDASGLCRVASDAYYVPASDSRPAAHD